MRNIVLAVIAGASLGVSLAAYADESQPSPQATRAAVTSEPAKVQCAYFVHDGTLIRRPVCRPVSDWANDRQWTREQVREFQQRSLLVRAQ